MYEILEQIRSQAKVDLVGDLSLLNNTRAVTISVKNRDLKDVLKLISAGQPVEFVLLRNTIIAKPRVSGQTIAHSLPKLKEPAKITTAFKLRGVVKDQLGHGLLGVSVRLLGGKGAVVRTQENGSYEITAGGDEILLVSMLGYSQQRVEVKGRTRIDITLQRQANLIDEVVVNTGYTRRPAPSMTGASSVITRRELEKFSHRNIFTVIQSLDPALHLDYDIASGANPNVIPEIYLRGINNIGTYSLNTPLAILDGFEVPLERLYDLDINRIESISLLKDVSSTVLYGSRGGNGVLVVETWMPNQQKASVTYSTTAAITVPDLRDYNLMNAIQKLDYEKSSGLYDVSTFYPDPQTIEEQQLIEEQQVLYDQLYNNKRIKVLQGIDTYWLSQPVQTSLSVGQSVRFEGRNNRLHYSLEGNLTDLKGAMKKSGRERKDAALTLQYRISEKLLLTNYTNVQAVKSYNSPYGSFAFYAQMNPYQPLYDGNGNLMKEYADEALAEVKFNPLYNVDLTHRDQKKSNFWSNRLSLKWNLSEQFVLRANGILERNRLIDEKYTSAQHTRFTDMEADSAGEYSHFRKKGLRYSSNINLSFKKESLNHKWNTNLIGEIKSDQFDEKVLFRKGFASDSINAIVPDWIEANAKSKINSENSRISRLAGILFTGNYIYKNKYISDFSYRIDGASNFGKNNRYSYFWSVGLGYNLHEEAFLKEKNIQELRFFVNTGVNGTEAFIANMNSSSYIFPQGQAYFKENAYRYNYEGNPNLKWPQIRSWNIGVTSNVWNERIKFSLIYYNKLTDRMISLITVAPSVGIPNNSYFENMGQLQNRGFESAGSIRLVDNISKNLNWSIGATAIKNSGKLMKISDALNVLNESNLVQREDGTYVQNTFYQQGASVNNIKGVKSLGIDPASGKEFYLTKEGRITDKWDVADISVIGNKEPRLFGTLNSIFNFKSLNIQTHFTYTLGGDIYNHTLVDRIENNDGRINTDLTADQERWKTPGDVVAFKDRRIREKTYLSSRFVERENTLCFSMLLINYDLRKEWITRYKLQRLKVNFAMNDVVRLSSVKMERGLDYPFAATFNFGIMAQF
ncbi:SusC/RagA family TonB-linked outer membrane protein [Sphingobacterium sp. SYP-B4668]|uniref:SusC/RagA family TonB-linked outer membrane protein n=1 Tax=Sphingobacterium sp. SYP-B4668 TaxID=2996035 RepID=UPI0022DD9077|nr:SusC/RagA family TonB-linked outer membrane protein [Sphingobacterium sp. SYP-B4668]